MTTTLSVTEVTTLVRRLLRVKESGVLAWQQEPLEWLNIMDAQLFRVHGEANLFDGAASPLVVRSKDVHTAGLGRLKQLANELGLLEARGRRVPEP
jgi:hypothetical protein